MQNLQRYAEATQGGCSRRKDGQRVTFCRNRPVTFVSRWENAKCTARPHAHTWRFDGHVHLQLPNGVERCRAASSGVERAVEDDVRGPEAGRLCVMRGLCMWEACMCTPSVQDSSVSDSALRLWRYNTPCYCTIFTLTLSTCHSAREQTVQGSPSVQGLPGQPPVAQSPTEPNGLPAAEAGRGTNWEQPAPTCYSACQPYCQRSTRYVPLGIIEGEREREYVHPARVRTRQSARVSDVFGGGKRV